MKPNIAEIKLILNKATPGHWYANDRKWPGNENLQYWIETQEDGFACAVNIDDAVFIANSREYVESLIGEVEKQTKEIDAMQQVIKDADEEIDRLLRIEVAFNNLADQNSKVLGEVERLWKALEQIKVVTSNSAAYTDGAKAHFIADQALRRDTQDA